MSDAHARKVTAVQKDASKVRNFCMLAHVDHGKTTLSDVLVSSNGLISQALAGKVRFMDCRQDEQERMITMKASTIALRHNCGGEDYVLNLIDSPGHVDFSCEVSTAVRLSDGGFLLVDAIDGVATQTRAVLQQAYREKVKCCLVINKVDLLITTKKMDPHEAYDALAQIIQDANVIMAEFVESDRITGVQLHEQRLTGDGALEDETEEQWFEPAKGNVIFASSIDGWGFTTASFASLYAKKLNWSETALRTALWGEWYLDAKRKKLLSRRPKPDAVPMCVKYVLEQVWRLYGCADIEDAVERGDALVKMTKVLGMSIREDVLRRKEPMAAVAAVMNAWLPLSRCVLDACVTQLPSPQEAQAYRIPRLLPELHLMPPAERALAAESLAACNPAGPPMAYIAKMFDTECLPGAALQHQDVEVAADAVLDAHTTSFVGIARCFSGSLTLGDDLYILDPKHRPGGEDTAKKVTVRQLFLLMGRGLAPVRSVSAGSIFGVGGLGATVLKSATLAPSPAFCGFSQMVFQSAAVIRMSVEPVNAEDIDKLKAGLALLNKADPQVEVVLTEQGEFVLCTAGEVHAERCIRDLNDRYAQVELRVSEPLVGFRETIVAEQKKPTVSSTPNKQCTFTIKAHEVPHELAAEIEECHEHLRVAAEYTAETVAALRSDREDVWEALQSLDKAFRAADPRWARAWASGQVWSLGPRQCGTNLLVCATEAVPLNSVWRALAALLQPEAQPSRQQHPAELVGDQAYRAKTLRQVNDSIVAGFQLATEKGPLCDEPMTGVGFFVEAVSVEQLDEAQAACYGPLSGQVMSAVAQGCRNAFMAEGKRLVEPVYECDIVSSSNCHGKVYEVLKRRRAEIIDNIPQEGTMSFRVLANLPVTESFGLADELRIKTSGHATPLLRFSHYAVIDFDPFFVRRTEDELEDMDDTDVALIANVPRTLINKVRKRKGLPVEEQAVQKAEKMKYSTRGG